MRIILLLALGVIPCALRGQTYLITNIGGYIDDIGDGGPAVQARFGKITAMASDRLGNVYVADHGRIRRISNDGLIRTIAGIGVPGESGDGGPAILAQTSPAQMAVDGSGVIYIVEAGDRHVREVQTDGTIVTLPTPATNSNEVTSDPSGSIYLLSGGQLLKIAAGGGTTNLVSFGFVGVGGTWIAADATGNVYLSTFYQVFKRDPAGKVTQLAGIGLQPPQSAIGGPIAVDSAGNLYIAVQPNYPNPSVSGIRRLGKDGVITSFGDATIGGLITTAPSGIYALNTNSQILAVSASGSAQLVAGGGLGDGGPAVRAMLDSSGVALDIDGSLYLADHTNQRVRRIDPNGMISTVGGTGAAGFSGDGGPATAAQFREPAGIALDTFGNIYVADMGNHRIRRIDRAGVVTTIAGTGAAGVSGDGGPAVAAVLNAPQKLTFDRGGNLYFIDNGDFRVRRITQAGTIETVAGKGLPPGCCDSWVPAIDGVPATQTYLFGPASLAFDLQDNLYVAESFGNRIRMIGSTGIITTAYDSIDFPRSLAFDAKGNLYVGEYQSVVEIPPSGAAVQVAGSSVASTTLSGVPATAACLGSVPDLLVDASGNVILLNYLSSAYYGSWVQNDETFVEKLEPANIFPLRIYNSASRLTGFLAPGEIVDIDWVGMGPSTPVTASPDANGQYPSMLAGARAYFNGVAAPILSVGSTKLVTAVPYSVPPLQGVSVQVEYNGQRSNAIGMPVAPATPALFPAVLNADSSVNSAANPAALGSIVELFVDGAGLLAPMPLDGAVATGTSATPVYPVTVQIGGVSAEVVHAGPAPGVISNVLQVDVRVPGGGNPGMRAVQLTIAGATTPNQLSVAVR